MTTTTRDEEQERFYSEQVEEIVSKIKLEDYIAEDLGDGGKRFENCVKFHCPFHVDEHESFSVRTDEQYWHCFSCGRGGNIINYIMLKDGLSYANAVHKAAVVAGVELADDIIFSHTYDINEKLNRMSKVRRTKKREYHDISEYDKYSTEPPKLWMDEGISAQSLRKYGVRVDHEQNRIGYPMVDMDDKFITFKWRYLNPNSRAKYKPDYPIGELDFFQGWRQAEKGIEESQTVVLFESIKSVMKTDTWGYNNTVSCEGHNVTQPQVEILIKCHVRNVVLAFDSDVVAYNTAQKDYVQLLKRFTNVWIINDRNELLGGASAKNAPVDCGKEIWEILYSEKVKLR